MPQQGIQTVTVPGCVDGWEKLHKRFGRLPWAEVLKPAIYYASNGFPVTEMIQQAVAGCDRQAGPRWRGGADFSARTARPRRWGRCSAIRTLAKALQLVAGGGADGVLQGRDPQDDPPDCRSGLAERWPPRISPSSRPNGSTPISTELPRLDGLRNSAQQSGHRGARDVEHHGDVSAFRRWSPSSPEALHLKIEAQKLAYQDLAPLRGRPALRQSPGGGNALEEIRRPSAPR